ncbi:polyprenyl synthetase family protein [Nonomuraea soli]|uniref:Geranylgeranyl diphosphate synthase type I n=1 Tax=Nonomuraea soli TaxID=1032476 RepID=A0A7W0CGY9_9ACTN|nr:polyprenyl synthetase family protein [Nonomuraea soli]MBA2890807.1 geranylgeranyl diphosphate synthase type I [Nonomuraea soli]
MTIATAPVDHVRSLADATFRTFIARRLDELGFLGESHVTMLREALAPFLGGTGKRLRPLFVYWGHRAAGGQDDDLEAVLSAGCAVELVHTAALVLDDVMDQSELRRGQPSAHLTLAAHGGSARFGESAATLVGMLALTWADAALLDLGPRLAPALEVLNQLRVEAVGGQLLDLSGTAPPLTVARYKSAKYTVERPLHLGHVLAGGDHRTRRLLSDYALPVGEAFQLRDDVLDVFGDPAVTGKPSGGDLRLRKNSLLLELARTRAGADGELLLETAGADIGRARELIRSCGALDEVEARIGTLVEQGVRALENARGPAPDAVAALADLAVKATRRER